jgi:serine/threonine protein kinase
VNAPATFSALNPGTVLLDKYRIVRELGSGGMGVVVLAEHLVLGQRVAIKFLLPELAVLPESTSRFLREARAASRIQGEHIVRVLDYGTLPLEPPASPQDGSTEGGEGQPAPSPERAPASPPAVDRAGLPPLDEPTATEGQPFIVMEYLEGRDLGRALKAGANFSIPEAIDFTVQAAEALAQAHHAGVIHRDIKPANLFLTQHPDGRPLVKMLDFGISKVVEEAAQENLELTKTTAVMGSALYMSLEQMRSTKSVDYRTDIYSLGITLYELLTHTHPFTADSFSELCVKVSLDPPIPITRYRPEIPAPLAEAIARAYARYPDDRYPTVGSFAAALAPFASPATRIAIDALQRFEASRSGQLPLVNPLIPPVPRPGNGSRRGLPVPGWLVGGLVGAVVAVIAFSYWLLHVAPPVLLPDAGAPMDAGSVLVPPSAPPPSSVPPPPSSGLVPEPPPSVPSVPVKVGPPRPPECRGKRKGEFYVGPDGLRRMCP